MIKIGVTGNIGSGKTTICQIFEKVGVEVYYADQRARQLMNTNAQLKSEIQHEFGKEIYQKDGTLNRDLLANLVFNDEEALKRLNKCVHPVVFEDLQHWLAEKKNEGQRIILEEAALTFEAGHADFFDLMLTVTAPESILIDRVVQRDQVSPKDVKIRLDRQMPQIEKALQSDIIILNDGQHSLIFQVQNIIDRWQLPISKNVYN